MCWMLTRGIDVDAVGQQFLDVEIALGMAAARRVGVGEFVDQRDLRPARDQRVEIHLLERLVLVVEPLARQHFEALQQRFGLRPAMGLDHADDDIGAGLLPGVRALQHLVGLADAGGGADKDLQPAGAARPRAGPPPAAHPARAAVQGRGAIWP